VLDLKSVRPLDLAIVVLLVVVLAIGTYLGISVYSHNRSVVESTPVSREINVLIERVRANPNNMAARMELAQALTVAGRNREAIQQYKAVLTVDKDYAPALAGLGFVALRQGQWQTGEQYFRRVIEVLEERDSASKDPQLASAYYYLGSSLLEQKKFEEAANNLRSSLMIRRDASDVHYMLAVCFRELGNDEKYEEALGFTLMFDPKMPEANYDMGMLLLDEGDEAGAAEHFRRSIDAAPSVQMPVEALNKLGTFERRFDAATALRDDDPDEALKEARIAAAIEPKSIEALVMVGDLWAEQGNTEQAIEAYRQVLLIDPSDEAAKAGMERVTNGS
jgi:tetratricopeptide (TPR) repeat protein